MYHCDPGTIRRVAVRINADGIHDDCPHTLGGTPRMKPDNSGWTLGAIWESLRKFWLLIAVLTIAGGGIAYALSASVTPTFQSKATLFFSLSQGNSASDLNQGSTYTQNQMLSFAQLATSSRVLRPVIDELDLDATPRELARDIEVSIPQQTVILEVQASSTDPEQAAAIANAAAASLTEVVGEISPRGAEGAPTISAQSVDEAVVPLVQALPNKTRDVALGAILGLIIGVAAALIISLIDTRVKTEHGVEQITGQPSLGVVTRMRTGAPLVVAKTPLSATAEEFRRIRSALSYADIDGSVRRLLVTSSSPGEGKSVFASNLALTLASTGQRVLLIDADLRRPRVADYYGVDGSIGLSTVLLGDVDFEEAKVRRADTSLDLLTSGSIPPNPADLFTSEAMRALIDQVSRSYDHVIVDSPPVLSVADANLLSPLLDGTIVVVDVSKTRRAQLATAMNILSGSGAHIVGTVANRVRPTAGHNQYYGDKIEA